MTMGTGLLLIAVGAILKFAVQDEIEAVNLETIGVILMVVGAIAFLVGAIYAFGRRDRVGVERVDVVERDRVVERPPRDPRV